MQIGRPRVGDDDVIHQGYDEGHNRAEQEEGGGEGSIARGQVPDW